MSDEAESAAEEAVEAVRAERRDDFRRIIQRVDRTSEDAPATEDVVAVAFEKGYSTRDVFDVLYGLLERGEAYCPSQQSIRLTEPVDDADNGEPQLVADGGDRDEEDCEVIKEDGILIADGGSEYGPCPGCGDVEPSYEVPGEPPFCPECGVELPPSDDIVTDGGQREVVERVSSESSAYTLKVEVLDPGENPEYEPAGYHSPTVLYTAFTGGQVHAHYDTYKLIREMDGRNDWLHEHFDRLREEVMADV